MSINTFVIYGRVIAGISAFVLAIYFGGNLAIALASAFAAASTINLIGVSINLSAIRKIRAQR